VCCSTYWASSGIETGPPWQSTITSGLTALAASHISWILVGAPSSVRAEVAPIEPLVVRPKCATTTSAPASAIAFASSGLKA